MEEIGSLQHLAHSVQQAAALEAAGPLPRPPVELRLAHRLC